MENLAVIELNESALKLSIYKTSSGRFKIIEEKSQPFKLAEEIMEEELLRPKTKNDMLEVLKIYRKMIETYKAKQIIAVASNFLQLARNYRGFIDEIYNNTGISFTIIQNEDVIKYNYHATVNSIDNSKGYLISINAFKPIDHHHRRTLRNQLRNRYAFLRYSHSGPFLLRFSLNWVIWLSMLSSGKTHAFPVSNAILRTRSKSKSLQR